MKTIEEIKQHLQLKAEEQGMFPEVIEVILYNAKEVHELMLEAHKEGYSKGFADAGNLPF